MKIKSRQHSSDLLFILLLFASLVLICILLIAMGCGVYENVLDSMNRNDDSRTVSAYLLQKVWQNQDLGAVSSGTLDGTDAIILNQNLDGKAYCTYLYCHDGKLCELFVRKDNTSLSVSSGTPVVSLDSMTVENSSGDSLLVSFSVNGRKQKLRLRRLTAGGQP